MIEVGNDSATFWLGGAILSLVIWWLARGAEGHPPIYLEVPNWLRALFGMRYDEQLDYKRFELQIFACVLALWVTLLAIFVSIPSHRNILFISGLVVGVIGLILFDIFISRLLKKPSDD